MPTTVWLWPTLARGAKQDGEKEFAIHQRIIGDPAPSGQPAEAK